MSYEKHTWETGEVITAEKLNNRVLILNRIVEFPYRRLDKTFGEIKEAFLAGVSIYYCREATQDDPPKYIPISALDIKDQEYGGGGVSVSYYDFGSNVEAHYTYYAQEDTDYPELFLD